jgi:hypothetical protein
MTKPLKEEHRKAAAKKNYFSIFSVEEDTQQDEYTPEEYKTHRWVVNFGVTTDKNDLDDHYDKKNHMAVRELKALLTTPFKGEDNPPVFEFELSKNWHTARVTTKERAEQLASEITYIFRNAGIEPMAGDDESLYPAKQPGTGMPVAFTPPRNPNR